MEFMLELEWFLGKKPSFSSFGWLRGRVVAMRGPASLATWGSQINPEPWQPSATCHPPVLQQQGAQHVGSVFCSDLVRDDHGLHHEVSNAG